MQASDKQRYISLNAAILSGGMLVSFILPKITDSMTDGRAQFLNAMVQIFPLICVIIISCGLMRRAITETE